MVHENHEMDDLNRNFSLLKLLMILRLNSSDILELVLLQGMLIILHIECLIELVI